MQTCRHRRSGSGGSLRARARGGGHRLVRGLGQSAKTAGSVSAAATSYPIAPGYSVNVRSGPGTNYSIVRVLPPGSWVTIYCQTAGQTVSGPYGTTHIWDNIANGQYVSDAYVNTGSDGYVAPRCG